MAGRANVKISVKGIDDVIRMAKKRTMLKDAIDTDIHVGVEKMAIEAFKNAPVETGALRSSILRSPMKIRDMNYVFGSYMPYAQRQEYEHKTKKLYLHRAVWSETPKLQRELKRTIKRTLK